MQSFIEAIKEGRFSDAVNQVKSKLDELAEEEVRNVRDSILEEKDMKKEEEEESDAEENSETEEDENKEGEESEKDKE